MTDMETKQIINWMRDKAARAEELSWQRMLKAAADRLAELNVVRKTNADVIRSMSDEKLAGIMVGLPDLDLRIGFCQNKPECEELLNTDGEITNAMCERCMLQWLKRDAEVQ